MDGAYKGLMQNWYEKANKGDDEEERKLVALEAQARKATEKKKRSAKKRSSQPTDVLASALHQKKRAKVPDEAMDRSRAARIEARRQGRLGGGVKRRHSSLTRQTSPSTTTASPSRREASTRSWRSD